MKSKVYFKVQFCTDISDWVDFPKQFFNISEAEEFASQLSSFSSLVDIRVIRIEQSVCNEFFHEPSLNFK